ncbi:MAG: penicillin-binding protein 2, partial [Myxococcales bacterium]
MAAVLIRPAHTRSRLRLRVVQVLVLALFATLFVRLWYVQVFTGDAYQAAAAHQSVRDVVVQPTRGLIVDAMGRPLVANRASWVVSVDRTVLNKLDDAEQTALLTRLAKAVKKPVREVRERTLLCGAPGSKEGTCWNGSPFQPVPVARDVSQKRAVRLLEQSEDYPGVVTERTSLRTYPQPFGINAAHLLGYLSPITEGELDQAEKDKDTSVNGASVVGRAGVEYGYDQYLRGQPGYKRVAVDSMGRVLGDTGTVKATEGDTVVTSIDARVQSVVEKQLHETITTARKTMD